MRCRSDQKDAPLSLPSFCNSSGDVSFTISHSITSTVVNTRGYAVANQERLTFNIVFLKDCLISNCCNGWGKKSEI